MNLGIITCVCSLSIAALAQNMHASEAYLYVSRANDHSIGIWNIDSTTGDLTEIGNLDVGAAAGSQCIHPYQPVLYAALRDTGMIASFRINVDTGELDLINQVDVKGSSAYLQTDRSTSIPTATSSLPQARSLAALPLIVSIRRPGV